MIIADRVFKTVFSECTFMTITLIAVAIMLVLYPFEKILLFILSVATRGKVKFTYDPVFLNAVENGLVCTFVYIDRTILGIDYNEF